MSSVVVEEEHLGSRLNRESPLSLWRGLTALAALVLLGGLAAGYQSTLTPVTLVVDGQSRMVLTHQETVGALLLDAGLTVYPEDEVQPGRDESLTAGMTVSVVHARPVQIAVDGQTVHLRTHAVTTAQMLAEAGVALGPQDRATVEPARPGDETLHIRVQRAVPFTVHENGQALSLSTTAATVGEALREAGIRVYMADRIEPGLGAPLSSGMHVYLQRSRPVMVHVDGRTLRTRTHRSQVAHVLADLGIPLTGRDYTTPPLDATLGEQTTIDVIRVAERFLFQEEPIPFRVLWQPDPDLEIDNDRLLQDGEPGILERRLRLVYENGEEVSRTVESEYVAVPPVDKIYGYGTQIVVRQLDTPSGPVEYWRVIRMLATSYSASTAGVPRTNPYYGRTRLGLPMRFGLVAVDPNVIPLGTQVYVPGYGIGLAADTGGAIRGRRIDLGYDDDNLVLWYRWVDVYILTPVPPTDQINYTLQR